MSVSKKKQHAARTVFDTYIGQNRDCKYSCLNKTGLRLTDEVVTVSNQQIVGLTGIKLEKTAFGPIIFPCRRIRKTLGLSLNLYGTLNAHGVNMCPEHIKKQGINIRLDFESYMVSTDMKYSWVERNRCFGMNWGGPLLCRGRYGMAPHICRLLH